MVSIIFIEEDVAVLWPEQLLDLGELLIATAAYLLLLHKFAVNLVDLLLASFQFCDLVVFQRMFILFNLIRRLCNVHALGEFVWRSMPESAGIVEELAIQLKQILHELVV